ncbi:MAG: citramalate synthase [Firmicutes bacterium]|nr:citramalate synthase [Bacillota bacterium]
MAEEVVLYDTTLRDGTQQAGISLSVGDKIRIARRLVEFGIPLVEGGWPGSNPKDMAFFERAPAAVDPARLAVFGATRRAGADVERDPQVAALLKPGVPTVTVVGKASAFQATRVLGTDREENLRMIADTVAHLRARGRTVVFDAEHFFDGYAEDPGYAQECLRVAARAGARWLVLCDTNGGSLPSAVARATARALEAVREVAPAAGLGIHTHNDSGLAVANSLAAVEAGARLVQGTVNGYGERCGNADLCQLLPTLQLKMGFLAVPEESLAGLVHLARFVAEVTNLPLSDSHPYVGVNAFTHKGGLHASGMARDRRAYEHIPPERVGAQRRVLASELAGQASLSAALGHLGLGRASLARLLSQIKEREHLGYRYEDAEASLELLALDQEGAPSPFAVAHYRVVVDGPGRRAEATAEVRVGEGLAHAAAFGNGPVAALDAALRKALAGFFPHLARIHLVDYRVRVIDGTEGASARVRVWAESTDGVARWRTVGVSTDVVAASLEALVDAFRYGLARVAEVEGAEPASG